MSNNNCNYNDYSFMTLVHDIRKIRNIYCLKIPFSTNVLTYTYVYNLYIISKTFSSVLTHTHAYAYIHRLTTDPLCISLLYT